MTTSNDEHLVYLNQKRASAELHLTEINKEIRETQIAITFERYGVKVGSIVASTAKNTRGAHYKVTEIKTSWRDKPWLEGNPKKKDGTFSTAMRHLYTEWELVTT